MPDMNPYMAQFADVPALVAPRCQEQVNSNLQALSSIGAEMLTASTSEPNDTFWTSYKGLRPYSVSNGILQVPVMGVLLNGFPFAYGRSATGYDYIYKAIERGLGDPEVKGIALVINSPGGMVAGNFDLVDKIYAARGTKPIKAFLAEDAYSAAYSIASAADSITVARTGGAGSIGVVTSHVDFSKALDEMGIKVTFIHAGKHKVDGNPYEPLDAATKKRIQAEINGLYDIFVATVARNRGMDEQAVRDTEALTFPAAEALSLGLVDSIGALDDSLLAFANDLNNKLGETTMSKEKMDTGAVDQTVIDAARAEGHANGKKEGFAEGVTAERNRISSIMKLDEAANRRDAAFNIAVTSDMSVEQTKSLLATLPESKVEAKAPEAGALFAAAMAADNPNLGGGAPAAEKSDADKIVAAYRAFTGDVGK
jgi:signal peptide peptidase SppA